MEDMKKAAENLFFGGQPTSDDLKKLAADGFKTVINMRLPEEESDLSPDQAKAEAEALGMRYLNIPVSVGGMDDAAVQRVHEALQEAKSDGPVLLH